MKLEPNMEEMVKVEKEVEEGLKNDSDMKPDCSSSSTEDVSWRAGGLTRPRSTFPSPPRRKFCVSDLPKVNV